MNQVRRRPFYTDYAWAFDLIIDRPVRKECAVIAGWLVAAGVLPGSEILDAGCGTGRYAIELARRGYIVRGIDLSPELIEVARQSVGPRSGSVSFAIADILDLPPDRYAGILCRGVLNDIIDDDRRDAVFGRFARALQPDGMLVLDVRAWAASVARKRHEPVFRKRVATDRGELTFSSVTELDPANQQLVINERHTLVHHGVEQVSDYQFVMRCWDRPALDRLLDEHGFRHVRYFGAYDPGVKLGATDRIVALAQRSAAT